MFPIFMTEYINYSMEGVRTFMPVYARSVVVCDGEALVGAVGRDVQWDQEIQQRLLTSRIQAAIWEATPTTEAPSKHTYEIKVIPIVMPTGDETGICKALLVELPNQGDYVQLKRYQTISDGFRSRCEAFADRWQKATSVECGVITGNPAFSQIETLFLDNKSTFHIAPLMTNRLSEILRQVRPALSNSFLQQDTQPAIADANGNKGPRL